jgi:PAS domain S-box-containing protein
MPPGSEYRSDIGAVTFHTADEALLFADLSHTKKTMDKSPRAQSDFDLTWLQLWASRTIDYAVIALAPDGAVRSWNPGAERIHEFLVAEIAGRPFSTVFTQEDVDRGAPEKALEVARFVGRYDTEMWQVRKNGSTFWASMVVTALHEPDGQLAGFGVIVRDISDKRQAHEAVVESERRFRLLVRGVTDYAIFMLSPDGYITNWNLGAERIKGYTSAQAIGMHFSRFYTDEDAAAGVPQRGLDTAARRGKFETEGWRVRADGSRFWAHVFIDAIRDDEGNLVGFAKITRDVTEQRHAAELLQQTQAALFQAQKMEAIGKLT